MPCPRTQQATLPACSPHYPFFMLSSKQRNGIIGTPALLIISTIQKNVKVEVFGIVVGPTKSTKKLCKN